MAIWGCHPIDCNRPDEVKKTHCFAPYQFTMVRVKIRGKDLGFDHVFAQLPSARQVQA